MNRQGSEQVPVEVFGQTVKESRGLSIPLPIPSLHYSTSSNWAEVLKRGWLNYFIQGYLIMTGV